MKHFTILTLFPQMFTNFLSTSIINKAIIQNKVKVDLVDIRRFSTNKQHQVDDYQFGGGQGMIMMIEPVIKAIRSCQQSNSIVVYLTPQGETYQQSTVNNLAFNDKHIILLCGHYEGIDERIINYVDLQISIGDYILTGGELASMILVDSITRLVPDVINNNSLLSESFNNNLLDYPVYTKPVIFENYSVPDILLSGHHQKINDWRNYHALKKTYYCRPDLLAKANLNEIEQQWLNEISQENKNNKK